MSSQETKQNFLYDEIIDQGYDAEAFMNFMAEAKEDGTNIEKWSMIELMNIVKEFKSQNSLSGKQEDPQQDEYTNYQQDQPSNQDYGASYTDSYQYAPPAQDQTVQQQPSIQEETYLQRYEREQKEQQQLEILSQSQPQQNSQIQQNQQQSYQQPQVNHQPKQSFSMSGSTQLQPQSLQNQQQSNTSKKFVQDDDPFASIQVKPANNQQQTSNQNNVSGQNTFSTTIPFDADLARLRKKDDFEFDMGFSNNNQIPNQQYKNNDIWNFSVPNNQSSQNGNQQNIWNMGQPANNTSASNAADPFSMFQSPPANTAQGNAKGNTTNNDPFNNFFSTTTPQVQKTPAQQPAPVQQNATAQKITESDLDDFFMGFTSTNTNKPPQNNTQIKPPQGNVPKPNQPMTNVVPVVSVGATAVGAMTNQKQPTNPPVQQQQSLQQKQQQQPQQKPAPQPAVLQNSTQQNKEDIASQIKEPKNESGDSEQFKTEKGCKKSVQTVVSVKPDVQVTIIEHEIVQGSLFSIGGSNLAIYHIKTMPFNWTVKRKYNDFIWLRGILIKMHPGIPVPPLPGKTMKSLDEKLVQRRKGYFESFLYEVLTQPDLKASKFITDFLSITDDKIFKQRVKETEKIKPPKNIYELETTTGKIILNKNPECNAHSQHLHDYFEQNDKCYENLKKLSKQLMEGYNTVGNILHQMGDTFAQLHTNIQTYDSKTMAPFQVKELEETYKIMNNMSVMQANSFNDQIKIFQNHFYNFFKFHKDNLSGLKEVVKTRNELNSVLAKKDSNESGGVLSGIFRSSKEAVNHPSKILKELDEQVGYYNEKMLQGSKKILDNRSTTYSKHFNTFCNLQKSIVTEMSTVWQDISDHFSNILKGEPGKKKIEIMKKVS